MMKTRNMLMKTLALLLVLSMGLSAAFAEGTVWESAKSVFYPDTMAPRPKCVRPLLN